jgi:hypothetical protein
MNITASPGSGGNGIRWLDSGTEPSRNVGTGTYYAVTTSADGCESGTAQVSVTIHTVPGAPWMYGEGTQCGGTRRIMASPGSDGNGIKWEGGSTEQIRDVVTGTYRAVTTSAAGCESGTASVAVIINPMPSINHISGDPSPTVDQNTELQTISFTATNFATFTMSGEFPEGVSGYPNGSSYTISGRPIVNGTFGYSLTASVNGCESYYDGNITVNEVITDFQSSSTWSYGGLIWSDAVRTDPWQCQKVDEFTINNFPAQYMIRTVDGVERYYYNSKCALYPCPEGWEVPDRYQGLVLQDYAARSTLAIEWAQGGRVVGSIHEYSGGGYFWTRECRNDSTRWCYFLEAFKYNETVYVGESWDNYGMQIRCVKMPD